MTVSYKDSATGQWLAGRPPEYLGLAVRDTGLGEWHEPESLEEAQERRRAHQAEQRAAHLSEVQVQALLGLSTDELYRDAELVGAAEVVGDELMFDASTIVERAQAQKRSGQSDVGEDAEEVSAKADALLADFRRQGLEVGP